MKNSIIKTLLAAGTGMLFLFQSCSDFEEINVDPFGANSQQVQVEYFINNAIIGAQQDPHIAERIFVLYWTTAGHFSVGGGIATGAHNDGWSVDYYGRSYLSGWLAAVNSAISIGEEQLANNTGSAYTPNLVQVARIWRAYLMSEAADMFGPIPLDGYQGQTPTYASLDNVYSFLLDELRDASSKLDLSVSANSISRFDQAYGFDFSKWQKYANSMRMRLAMRLSEVDAAKAKAEFEAAAAGPYITSLDETFQVDERPGWDGLTGVFTRTWNHFNISSTLNNLFVGLGGIPSADQLATSYASHIKSADHFGVRYENHFATLTNDPSAGYWFDGLPNTIDPRAYKIYAIPGDINATDYPAYATLETKRNLLDADGDVFKEIDLAYTWNGFSNGAWGTKGTRNQVYAYAGATPRLNNKFRTSDNSRVFFGPWESYFLLAEAAVRGWSVQTDGKTAYETGIDRSFAYWGVSNHASAYKASTDYNRVGTSVSWDHTAEPPASRTFNYVDGYTGAASTVNIAYPTNHIYKNGSVKNDLLTKIITQKYIAQVPWLPLEAWSDQRRIGLPFFSNPAIEGPIINLPDLSSGNYMTSSVKFFPQRITYPSSIVNSNPTGYDQAKAALAGEDNALTPLWWAQK